MADPCGAFETGSSLAGMNNAGYNITAQSLALTHSCNADNGSP
jgi:hypothetical protein